MTPLHVPLESESLGGSPRDERALEISVMGSLDLKNPRDLLDVDRIGLDGEIEKS